MAHKITTSSVLPAVVFQIINIIISIFVPVVWKLEMLVFQSTVFSDLKTLDKIKLNQSDYYDIELTSQFLLNRIQNVDDRSKNSKDSLESLNVVLVYSYLLNEVCVLREVSYGV